MRTTVYFATNRQVAGQGASPDDYGSGIVPPSDPGQLTFGTAFVDGTDLGAGTSGRIIDIQDVSCWRFGAVALGDLAAPGRNILVFVHGFDNTFEDAVTRAAHNREWMAASGAAGADMTVAAFCWPSLGRLVDPPFLTSDYQRDQTMAGQSGVHVMRFFAALQPLLLQARARGSLYYLLCHSMGNWALQAAVESWMSHGMAAAEMFDQAILAAADERYDSFDFPVPGRLSGLGSLARRISILYSRADLVLTVSAAVNRGLRRLGQEGPHNQADPAEFPPAKFRMVDCSGARDYEGGFMVSHQYYRLSPGVRAGIAAHL